MSWSRIKFDQCAYQKQLSQSTSPINYSLDPNKFSNCNDCRIEFGVIAGNDVSVTKGNMVDLESDLMNITRQHTKCPERQFLPYCEDCQNNPNMSCNNPSCKKIEQLKHLPSCNIAQPLQRIDHIGYDLKYPGCPVNNFTSIDGQQTKYTPQINPINWGSNDEQHSESGLLSKLNPSNWFTHTQPNNSITNQQEINDHQQTIINNKLPPSFISSSVKSIQSQPIQSQPIQPLSQQYQQQYQSQQYRSNIWAPNISNSKK